MEPYLIAAAVAVVCFVLFFVLVPKSAKSPAYQHTRKALDRLYEEQEQMAAKNAPLPDVMLREDAPSGAGGLLLAIPGMKSYYDLLLRSGMSNQMGKFFLLVFVVFALTWLVTVWFLEFGAIGWLITLATTFILPRKFLQRKILKRNEDFLNMFPDAIDMIVRSVRTGHPFNAALKMIVENMDPPMSTEFKQVVDEVAYGRTMTDALIRLSKRIDEPDLHFFVVILSVQQETGGNLAEVLSNLSSIIRKRKQLRQKIKAMTAEGRVTAIILALLPLFVIVALQFTSPGYLSVLLHTSSGKVVLGVAVSMIMLAFWIVNKMVQIDI